MSSPATTETFRLRKANDVFASGRVAEPALLFDQFWREGELALFFGTHGVGKSFMAVEIGEALARGRPIAGLAMPARRRRVLYVDLVLSDGQFGYRYSSQGRRGRRNYKFSENFHRDCPPDGADLIKWLRTLVEKGKPDVLIIDDLSMVSRTDDGTRQTMELVREVRQMTRRLGISVLVLADSNPYTYQHQTAERDLRRRRVLCSYADSVFAISSLGNGSVWRKLVQTRTQSDDIVWMQGSPAYFRLSSRDDGFVGFDFVEAEMSEEERDLICRVKAMRDYEKERASFRQIADRLEISKSRAARLYGKWKPSLERAVEVRAPGISSDLNACNQYESDDGFDVYGFDYHGKYHYEGDATRNPKAAAEAIACGLWVPDHVVEQVKALAATFSDEPENEPDHRLPACGSPNDEMLQEPDEGPQGQDPLSELDLTNSDPQSAPRPRSIRDLEPDHDHNGNPIYVESRREHDGKPLVWYQFGERSKTYTRWERTTFAIKGKNLGRSHYLEGQIPVTQNVEPRGP